MLTGLVITLYDIRKAKQEKSAIFVKYDEIIINKKYSDINPLIFGTENCEKGHAFGPYVRTYWLLHFVSQGAGTFTIRGKEYPVKPGQIFVIPPYEETYYQADMNTPWTYTWIGFTTSITLPEAFESPVIHCPEADKIFRKMFRCSQYKNGKSAYLCSCLWELISALSEAGEVTNDYVDKAKSMIDSEYMTDLSITSIANSLNINRSYLFSLFKKQLGISPRQYLIRVRLEKAAELMTVYQKSITISALSVGYQDIYNFSKVFKLHYGVSPRTYCANYQRTHRKKASDFQQKAIGIST